MSLTIETLINHSAKRLKGVKKSEDVADFAQQNPHLVEKYVGEFDKAVGLLNEWLQEGYHGLLFAPNAKKLHPHLGLPPIRIPTITQMMEDHTWTLAFIRGIAEERKLLLAGESDRAAELSGSEKIMFSSLDTSLPAKTLGAIGHSWERTCSQGLVLPTNRVLEKDDLLIPLEDVIVFFGEDEFPTIYPIMSTPPNPASGGLGWISAERIANTREMLGK